MFLKPLRFLILIPLALLLIIAGALPWYEQFNREKVRSGKLPRPFFYTLPFMDKPQAAMAYMWLQDQKFDGQVNGQLDGQPGEPLNDQLVEQQIERALVARPLRADNFLRAARVKHKLGKLSEAKRLAEQAHALAPRSANLLWNLAMFWLSIPERDKAIALLHDYLLAKPHDVEKVLFLAYRFKENKEALLDALIPAELAPVFADRYDEDYYAARILRTGLKLKNTEMAEIAWGKFKNRTLEDNPNAAVIKAYVNFLIAQNDKSNSFAVWQAMHPELPIKPEGMNTGFEHELLEYGFGWRTNQNKGVNIERSSEQRFEGNYSLKISLDGTENINLYRPAISLPVEGGLRYKLSVYWKGEQITTRANPFFEILYKQDEKYITVRSKPERGSWNWQRVELEIDVPTGVPFIELRLRRWKTNALDNLISGTIYIDDVRLEPYP